MNDIYTKRNKEKLQDISCNEFKKMVGNRGVLMGIDYGSVRIGIALSDEARDNVYPFKIISKINELDDIVPSKNVIGFVVGLPLQTNGEEGATAIQARLFANRLVEKYQLPILWIDERYSSLDAESYLKDSCLMRAKNRKKVLDAHVAARLLYQAIQQIKKIDL